MSRDNCQNYSHLCFEKPSGCFHCDDYKPIDPFPTLLDNLAAFADRLETYSKLLETAHAEIRAEQAKTDEILKNIKKSWAARNEN